MADNETAAPPGELAESAGTEQQERKPLSVQEEQEKAIVEEAVEFYSFVKDTVESDQRHQEEEDLTFEQDPWLASHRTAREEHDDPVSGQKIAAKPTMSMYLLDQPIDAIVNEARQAKLAISVKPRAGIANTKVAGQFKGLLRAIQAESAAQDARLWALGRTARCGRGAYLIRAEFANDGDFDVDLIVERILNQDSVFWDPYAQRADKSDSEKCLTVEVISIAERKRRWPKKPIQPPASRLEGAIDHPWFVTGSDGQTTSVLVATYHKVQHHERALGYHPSTGELWLKEMPPEIRQAVESGAEGTRVRDVDIRTVDQFIIDGTQILEKHEWLGRYIPVIPTIGKEYNIKGKRSWKGAITNTKDVLRAINVIISSATEIAGSMPRIPYIMALGMDSGVEEMWDDAATKSFTRLYYNPVDVHGKLAPPPARQTYEIEIQGLMFLLKMLLDMFHGITGSVPNMLALNPSNRSGKALDAFQRQGQMATSNYLDNLANISMVQEGRVLVDAVPKYYDRPGRVLNIMGEENDDETAIMVKTPFVRDEEGNPIPVPCPHCAGRGVMMGPLALIGLRPPSVCRECQGTKVATRENMPPEYQDQEVEYVDFADGQFKVTVSVEKEFKTKQQEALAGMTALAEAAPQLLPSYADLWVRAMGFSGANEIADRIKATNPAAQSEKELKNIPPRLRSQFQLLKAKHDQAMQALEQAQKIIETDQMKAAGQTEIAVLKAAFAEKIEGLKAEGRVMAVKEKGQQDAAITALKGDIVTMQQEMTERHEIILQLLKEKQNAEQERHSLDLHERAAIEAEARLEDRELRSDARNEERDARTSSQEEARQVRVEDRAASREGDKNA